MIKDKTKCTRTRTKTNFTFAVVTVAILVTLYSLSSDLSKIVCLFQVLKVTLSY